jgi:hypothetical protein
MDDEETHMGPRLGTCTYPKLTQAPDDHVDQSYCEGVQGGVWSPDVPPIDPNAGTSGGFCAVRTILARALAENIMQLGKSYHLTYLFRDRVLYKSKGGTEIVKGYYAHAEELYLQVITDPEVLGLAISVWGQTHTYVKALLQIQEDASSIRKGKLKKLALKSASQDALAQLFRKFAAGTESAELRAFLGQLVSVSALLIGKDPKEGLEILTSLKSLKSLKA